MSQVELGRLLGIADAGAQSRVSHYESRRREVPHDVAYRFIDLAQSGDKVVVLEDVYPRERSS